MILSTQNPVDLDYKGLSNTGTWFIGRLQTERDKRRVLEGLEGAAAGGRFDRARMEEILAGLGKRVFLLHNVHENEPAIFQTRWVLSYLRGPMTREHIKILMAPRKSLTPGDSLAPAFMKAAASNKTLGPVQAASGPPISPSGVDTFFLAASGAGHGLVYYSGVVGCMDVHYFNAKHKVDTTETLALAVQMEEGPVALDWDSAIEFDSLNLEVKPFSGGEYADLPSAAKRVANYRKWNKDLLRWIRQNRPILLLRSKNFRMTSRHPP